MPAKFLFEAMFSLLGLRLLQRTLWW